MLLSCEYIKIWNNLGDLGVYLGSLCKYGMELKEKISHIEPQNHISSPQSDINPTSDNKQSFSCLSTRVSSTASAQRKHEAEVVFPTAQQKLLKNKHALEEEQLWRKNEQMEMEAHITVITPEIKVLWGSQEMSRSDFSKISDAMESYFAKGQLERKRIVLWHDFFILMDNILVKALTM